MVDLTFADSHNMVAYLEKSEDNVDFAEIVDFHNVSPIRNIPIVASSSQQKKTQKHRKAKRKATEISQTSRPTTFVEDEAVHRERGDSVERAATTATSLDADPRRQDTMGDRPAQTRFERLSKQSNEPPLSRVITLGTLEIQKLKKREEEPSKATNIVEWDDVQAMMDAEYELATKLKVEEQGEISIEERSKLFMELMNERKKHFTRLRAEE
ncbi:hypothetical protein Tco_1282658 [Tanacetum coccineum]